jgi:HK97 gp10 family phage protein
VVEIETKLSGDLTAGLDKFAQKVQDSIALSGVAAMARVVYDEVLLNTSPPRMGMKTGNLHGAVYRAYSPERSGDGQQIYHVSVNKRKAPHWYLLEYGTSRMRAHPYLRPALSRLPSAVKAGMARMAQRMAEEGAT